VEPAVQALALDLEEPPPARMAERAALRREQGRAGRVRRAARPDPARAPAGVPRVPLARAVLRLSVPAAPTIRPDGNNLLAS
jgi:hypothetical protein